MYRLAHNTRVAGTQEKKEFSPDGKVPGRPKYIHFIPCTYRLNLNSHVLIETKTNYNTVDTETHLHQVC